MNAYNPLSTGYDALAESRHRAQLAQAAVETENLSNSFDEELIEDNANDFGGQCMPKGMVIDGYGKSSGRDVSRNANGLKMSSVKEKHRHCLLGGVDRNQSPDPIITYTYDIPKPIEYDPNYNTVEQNDRGVKPLRLYHIPRRIYQTQLKQEVRVLTLVTVLRGMVTKKIKCIKKHGDKYFASTLRTNIAKSLKKLKTRY